MKGIEFSEEKNLVLTPKKRNTKNISSRFSEILIILKASLKFSNILFTFSVVV